MGCGSSSASPPVATPNDANATQKYSQQNAQQNANASKQPAATAASKAQAPAPAESKAPAQPQAQVQTQANQQSGQPAANQQSAQQPAQQPKEQPQQALQPPQLQTLSVGVQLSSSPSLGKSPTITRSPTEMKSLSRYLVLVSILQGRNIKKKDLMGDSDAYVKVSLSPSADASPPKETKTVNNTQKPVWNQQFRFEQLTTAGPRPEELIIDCYNRNTLRSDDLIGSCKLALAPLYPAPPSWRWLDLTMENNGQTEITGQIQVQVDAHVVTDANESKFLHLDSSHVLSITLIGAQNLKDPDGDNKTDAYAQITFGSKSFRTKEVPNSQSPSWNAETSFWVDKKRHSHYMLEIAVFDKDDKREQAIGFAYVEASQIFSAEASAAGGVELTVKLQSKRLRADKDLTPRPTSDDPKEAEDVPSKGEVRLKMFLQPVEELQQKFFTKILEDFDTDGSGKLVPDEIQALISSLGIDMSQEQFENWFAFADENKDGELSAEEVLRLLMCTHFVGGTDISRILHYLLKAAGKAEMPDILMEGVTHHRKAGEIMVKDRVSGLVVKENIPPYIEMALKSMFNSGVGRVLSSRKSTVHLMTSLSIKQGKKYDKPESKNEIPAFVKLHNLNTDEIEKPLEDYATMNEFFARKLKPSARPIDDAKNPNTAVCPADCRLMVFEDIIDATKFWVKGDQFTIDRVLGPRADLAPRFVGGSMVIARLAPQDYHRWHMPVSGVLASKTPIAGALYTVNPIAINKNVNVYTQNKREIFEIDSDRFGKVILVAVGATMVGAITSEIKVGERAEKGQIHGYFSFGTNSIA